MLPVRLNPSCNTHFVSSHLLTSLERAYRQRHANSWSGAHNPRTEYLTFHRPTIPIFEGEGSSLGRGECLRRQGWAFQLPNLGGFVMRPSYNWKLIILNKMDTSYIAAYHLGYTIIWAPETSPCQENWSSESFKFQWVLNGNCGDM